MVQRKRLMQCVVGGVASVALLAVGLTVPANADDAETVLESGSVTVDLDGTYYTDSAETLLGEINQIRYEACEEGVPDPRTNGKTNLTVDDYVEIKWSSDLEAIARQRAAEASVYQDHTRPSGDNWNSVTSNNVNASGEVLAWNYSTTILDGIEQWYGEMNDWVNQNTSEVTGHYTALINPNNTYVGLGLFACGQGWNTTAGEFSQAASLDETKDNSTGTATVPVTVSSDMADITNLKVNEESLDMTVGDTSSLYATVDIHTSPDNSANTNGRLDKDVTGLTVSEGISWSSSNTDVATVSDDGVVTAISTGSTTITAQCGNLSATAQVTVGEDTVPLTHTVSFDTDGGSSIDPVTVNDGDVVSEPEAPTKDGYTFAGWLLDGVAYDFSTPVTSDITLTASWTETDEGAETGEGEGTTGGSSGEDTTGGSSEDSEDTGDGTGSGESGDESASGVESEDDDTDDDGSVSESASTDSDEGEEDLQSDESEDTDEPEDSDESEGDENTESAAESESSESSSSLAQTGAAIGVAVVVAVVLAAAGVLLIRWRRRA